MPDGLRTLRRAVFIQEQGVPEELEWDEADQTALHGLTVNALGMPLATGRLLAPAPGVARIGRLAVHAAMRGSGLGQNMVARLMAAARDRGDREVVLDAQCQAQGFYVGLGFVARGPVFMEAGIEHVEMVRTL